MKRQRKHSNTTVYSHFATTRRQKELIFIGHIVPTPVANLKALWMDPWGFLIST